MKISNLLHNRYFLLSLTLGAAISGYSQNVGSRGFNLNLLPATTPDVLRVNGITGSGYLSHWGNPAASANPGNFGAADKWILIGSQAPANAFYGYQMQWNGQGYNRMLRERTPGGIKDATLEWGGQAGSEFQLRFLPNAATPAVFNRQFTMNTAGNSYFGATPAGFGGRVEINTANQLAMGLQTTNNRGLLSIVNKNLAGGFSFALHGITRVQAANSFNWGVAGVIDNQANVASIGNYGVAGYIFSNNLNGPQYGVFGQAPVSPLAPGTTATSYAGFFQGDVYATGMYYGSDSKYKIDIKDEVDVLSLITNSKCRPVKYFMNNALFPDHNFTNREQHGFLAEELQSVFPEVVQDVEFILRDADLNEKGRDRGLAINYPGLVSILFQAIKEQQVQINALKEAIGVTKSATGKNADEKPAVTGSKIEQTTEEQYTLFQNSPNPFNQNTAIRYQLPGNGVNGVISVFDINGNMLIQYNNLKGSGQVELQGSRLQPGAYIYTLAADGKEVQRRKMVLTR